MSEPSTKPYLIRAIHEWCSDNGYRPYLAVAVDARTVVPREFVRNGEIVLNVSVDATNRLRLGNDLIEFEARFGGVARQVSVPVDNVAAIYAAENGHGMAFEVPKAEALAPDEARAEQPAQAGDEPGPPPPARVPMLLVDTGARAEAASAEAAPEPEPPATPGGRPKLTRIK